VIVTIDGPAGAGKSTVARGVALRLGVGYLDTGAMYRALTWLAQERGVPASDGAALSALAGEHPVRLDPTPAGSRVHIAGRDVTGDIRGPRVSAQVSEVSAHPEVRARMVAAQRAACATGDWVLEGRDVGSTVCPDATVKVFLTASAEQRARRRHAELAAAGAEVPAEEVLADVRRRDELDSTRAASPLRVPDGAVVVDSSALAAEDVVELVAGLAERARAEAGAASP
jgi:CMP/dCMP kinase